MSDPRTEPSFARAPEEPPTTPTSSSRPRDEPTTGAGTAGEDATSDEILLLGARLRDESALAQLFDRYSNLVYTLALRIVGDGVMAEGVVQDVFLRCWHGLEQYDASQSTVPGWLLGITRGRAIDLLRGRPSHGRSRDRETLAMPAAREQAVAALAVDVDLRKEVEEALAELSESQRAAVEAAYYGGLTQTEVAEQLGEPVSAVKLGIRDGMRRLRRLLAPIVDPGPVRGRGSS